jgi:hypothetical protein
MVEELLHALSGGSLQLRIPGAWLYLFGIGLQRQGPPHFARVLRLPIDDPATSPVPPPGLRLIAGEPSLETKAVRRLAILYPALRSGHFSL